MSNYPGNNNKYGMPQTFGVPPMQPTGYAPPGYAPGPPYQQQVYPPNYGPPQGYAPPPFPSQGYAPPPQGPAGYGAPPPMPGPPGQVQWLPPAGYNQSPALTSPCNGRKKALLIGINYQGTPHALRGCVNDVMNIKNYLCNYRGFPSDPANMVILTDDNPNPVYQPTRRNIIEAMRWLASANNFGDSVVFHYSGHGGQRQDTTGDESDGMDETIMPLDFKQAGVITDDEMNDLMVKPLPYGVRLTAIFDCCHSGSSLDLPFMYYPDGRVAQSSKAGALTDVAKNAASNLMRGNLFGALTAAAQGLNSLNTPQMSMEQKMQTKGNMSADIIMFSGCKDQQTSADAYLGGQATGAMSFALLKALQSNPNCSYGQLLQTIRVILQQDFHQVPQLSTGRFIDLNQMFMI